MSRERSVSAWVSTQPRRSAAPELVSGGGGSRRAGEWCASGAGAGFGGVRGLCACIWNAISLALSGMRTFSPIRHFFSFPRRYEWLLCYAVVPNNSVRLGFLPFLPFLVPWSVHCLLFWPFVVHQFMFPLNVLSVCFVDIFFLNDQLQWGMLKQNSV